jgi:hypothetical protein
MSSVKSALVCPIVAIAVMLGCSASEAPKKETRTAGAPSGPPAIATQPRSEGGADLAIDSHAKSAPALDGEPEKALRQFLVAMATQDEAGIRRSILAHPEAPILFQATTAPAEAKAQMLEEFRSAQFERLHLGQEIQLPGGRTLVLDESRVNKDHQALTYPGNPVPFILVRDLGVWKVDAGTLIAARRAGKAAKSGLPRAPIIWSPDQTLAHDLGPETNNADMRIQPPAAYKLFDRSTPQQKVLVWTGPVQQGETYAMLMILAMPEGLVGKGRELGSMISETLDAISKHRNEWTTYSREFGQIDGQSFVRARWSGICSQGRQGLVGKPMRGVVYVGHCGDNVVQIMIEDVVPHDEATLPLCEAAALTFKVSTAARP